MADVNHRYFVEYIKTKPGWKSLVVLDYGCGSGDVVRLMRKEGVNCFGTDLASSLSNPAVSELVRQRTVLPLNPDGTIPFSWRFDIVISNQVLEHVRNLDGVLSNIEASLKPYGIMYHHFPVAQSLREAHIGIPFAHWFSKGPARFVYAFILRCLGFGLCRENQKSFEWTRNTLAWLDSHCFYRDLRFFHRLARRHRYVVRHREVDYIRFRLKKQRWIGKFLYVPALRSLLQAAFIRAGFAMVELIPVPTRKRLSKTPAYSSRVALWRALALATYPKRDYSVVPFKTLR